MKPLVIDKQTEEKLLMACFEKFKKELESFKFNMNDSKFSMSMDLSEPAKEKVTILYTQDAYLKMEALVDFYDTEVGWYGLVEQINDKLYRVYDVKVCKQYVNGGKVDTEDEDTLEFFDSLSDEEIEHMHFQAHSHVKMSTSASGIDLQNQTDVVRNMGSKGFYIFQIWNKLGDINTYLYDLDNNVFYDNKDVLVEVESSEGTLADWVANTKELVCEKKTVWEYNAQQKKSKKNEKESAYEPTYLPGYYPGNYNNYDPRWDW